ncbi:uncharacterized protein LOC108871262 [Brassica rapa]|nr:uncharacterized protein LOC108871262 [Brassica rapa]
MDPRSVNFAKKEKAQQWRNWRERERERERERVCLSAFIVPSSQSRDER